jgi:hypothetical protein
MSLQWSEPTRVVVVTAFHYDFLSVKGKILKNTIAAVLFFKELFLSHNLIFYQHSRMNFYFEDLKYARRPV